jgi:DNA polymerase-4
MAGFYIWQRILGLEQDEVRSLEDDPKSFGHSWVLNFRTTDKAKLSPVIMRLAEKAARRMRRAQFTATGVYLSATDVTGRYFHVSRRLHRTINTGQELYREALKLWAVWEFKREIMHIAVGFTGLLADSRQLDLFGEDRLRALTETLDAINDRYGEFTIRPAILTETSDFAPDAIAFGK